MSCIWFELLSRSVPIAKWRLHLCVWHVNRCPRCGQASVGDEALPAILVTSEQLSSGFNLWPGIKKQINGLQVPGVNPPVVPLPSRRPRRWAVAAVMATVLFVAGIWILFLGRQQEKQPGPAAERPALQTRVFSASIGNLPARVFLIQSRDPNRAIFWIAKDEPRS